MDEAAIAEAVRKEFAPFLDRHGFQEVGEDRYSIVYESSRARVRVVWDPRGEIDVSISRLDEPSPHGRWEYGEIATASSVPAHLQRVMTALDAHPGILSGDPAFYDALRHRNEQLSREWTAYYSGNGPRPRTGSAG